MLFDELGLLEKAVLLKRLKGSASAPLTYTGNLPATITAVAHALASLTRYGLCTQDGTPTPDAPADIMTNNGALKYSANMANVNEQTARVGYYINAQGSVLADTYNWFYQAFIPCKPNTTYTLSMSQSVYFVSISEYSTAEDSGFIVRKNGSTGSNTSLTVTTGANTNFIRFGTNLDRTAVTLEEVLAINWMLNIGTAMDYQPYVEGGIYCGGTHPGQNLVDLAAVTDGYYYDTSGVYTELADARLTDFIPVTAGQKYTVYAQATQSGLSVNVRCNLFDAGKVWKSQSVFVVAAGNSAVSTITPSENGYLRVSANYAGTGAKADWSTFQIVRGEYTLATMPPYEPYTEIPYTPEVLTVSGKNLFDKTDNNLQYGNRSLAATTDGYWFYAEGSWSLVCPCLPNTQYTISGINSSASFFRVATVDVDTLPGEQETYRVPYSYIYRTTQSEVHTFVTPSTAKWIIVQVNSTVFDSTLNTIQIEQGSTATAYEPYVQPQTASVPMLLGIGNYKDEAELINGIKTGKVGIKVLDGTETWEKGVLPSANYYYGGNTILNRNAEDELLCNQFVAGTRNVPAIGKICVRSARNGFLITPNDQTIDTADKFKQFLAAQYAAGTPVIILYPLATETTEQTTPNHLVTHKGTNVVDSTANVEPVEAKIEYRGKAA